MKKTEINWLSIVSLAITVLLSIFKNEANAMVIFPIIGIVLAILVVNIIITQTKANRNLSNTAVIDKSKKYTKYLWKIVKANQKQMLKEVNISDFKKIDKNNNKIIKLVYSNGDFKQNEEKQAVKILRDENKVLINNYYSKKALIEPCKQVVSKIKRSNAEKAQAVYNVIYKNISSFQRILLQLEQHSLRIKLGKYVVACTNNIDEAIDAYVDYLGWTNILLGDNKKGFEYIEKGLELINYKIDDCKDSGDNEGYCKYVLLKARALRHMGTTYYTYKSKDDNFVEKSLKEALELCEIKEVKEYFETHDNIKYDKMVFGIKYNQYLLQYFELKTNKDLGEKEIKNLKRNIEVLEEDVVKDNDKHRLVKVETLKNQVDRLYIATQSIAEQKEDMKVWSNNFEANAKTIEKVLNENIYFDEAMEVYIYQKIQNLFYDVEQELINID